MKLFRRTLAVALVVILTLSSVSTAVSAADDDYSFVPSASFVSSGVTRVAGGVDSCSHGTTIVAATPSGYPQLSGDVASYIAYAGETPSYTTVTLTLDKAPDETPVASCPNVTLSPVSQTDTTFTWAITGGTAQAGTTLDITANYKYDSVSYSSHAFSYVCNIETGSAYALSYHTVNNRYTTHKYYAQNAINARFMGSNVVYKLSDNENRGNYYYNYNTGKLEILESGDYNTSLFLGVTNKTDTGNTNLSSTNYGDVDHKAVAHAYFDTSVQTSFADTGMKYVVNGATKYDPASSGVNSSYFNSTSNHINYIVTNALTSATDITNNEQAAAKLNMNFVYSTGKKEFGTNTLAINSPLNGSLENIADGESFTVNNAFSSKNTSSMFYDISNTLLHPVYLTVHKYDKSALRQAIDYVLNTSTDTIDVSTTVGKGVNPQEWYYSEGFSQFLSALKNANGINQKIDATQSEIDDAAQALYTAYEGLVLKGADYTQTNALLKVAAVYYENHPSYLEEQFQNLVTTVNALDLDIHILAQPAVEKQNTVLEEALEHMKLIPADYTALVEAMQQQPEYAENYYSSETYGAWKDLFDEAQMIITFETISYYDQDLIPVKAAALLEALNALEYADADLTPINEALALVVYDVENYKNVDLYNAWLNVKGRAEAYCERDDINVFNNEEINALALELTNAYNALELKDADTTALVNAVALLDKVNEEDCVPSSYASFKAAVEQGADILARESLTILDNAEINQCTQNILDKYFALEMTPADKTALETALALAPQYSSEYYTEASYTAYNSKKSEAQLLFYNNTLLQSDNDHINEVAQQLTNLFNALTLKDADTSALQTALALVPEYEKEAYTVESYSAYETAVSAGTAILERSDLTILDEAEINQAALNITQAYAALELEGYTFSVAENSTAIIDRTNGYIYGLEEGISSLDGYVKCENCTLRYTETDNGFGTGTKVEVIQRGNVVETFNIVIFGDVTGDGFIDAFDVSVISSVANYELEFEENSPLAFAADLEEDGFVDSFDLTVLMSAANYETPVSQQR